MAVYFVRAEGTDAVKIGFSVNVEHRLAELQCGSPVNLTFLRVIDGDRSAERWMHRKFSARRLHREWFAFDEAMLSIEPPSLPCSAVSGLNTQAAYIIDRFGGLTALADAVDRRITVVQGWKERGTIPLKHYAKILAAGRSLDPPFDRNEFIAVPGGSLHAGLSDAEAAE